MKAMLLLKEFLKFRFRKIWEQMYFCIWEIYVQLVTNGFQNKNFHVKHFHHEKIFFF